MSATSALENNEDLENVPLVRMADVQPDRSSEMYLINNNKSVSSYPCEDDCNIGSMVSIQSEDAEEEGNETELIIPDSVDTSNNAPMMFEEKIKTKTNPEHWPTLEILPGGVIKYEDKYEDDLTVYQNDVEVESEYPDMMFACAKCPQRFNNLFTLVKHVKLHEIQKRREEDLKIIAISLKSTTAQRSIPQTPKIRRAVGINKSKKKAVSKTKCKVPKRS